MTREEAKKFAPILEAYAEGKVIECRTKPSVLKRKGIPNEWTEMKQIGYWNDTEYRIKPGPTYRPFKDAEECYNEMLKHKPFGWLKNKEDGHYPLVTAIDVDHISLNAHTGWLFSDVMKLYTFADGTPFGIKAEE